MATQDDAYQSVLHQTFHLEGFRVGQREIIDSVMSGRDALAVLPTGGGKSLCYQLPAASREGIVVVVSPLIALMKDQVRQLRNLGIPAGAIHSDQRIDEKREIFAELARSQRFLLYLSPERVQKAGFVEWLKGRPIHLFAIDEAHCVSQWGPDFRPDYHKLKLLRDHRPDVPILALTATATPEVLFDISVQLKLPKPDRHVYGFYRPNLFYQVEACENDAHKMQLLRAALRGTPSGRVLIYCGTRKKSEELVAELGHEFEGMGYYHAGMDTDERTRVQREFEERGTRILAATNAFGMGIDHPDVRLVVHYQLPANIESLYQEMGRAGRDGQPSTCLLMYSKKDKGLHAFFINQSTASAQIIRRKWQALEAITQFAEGGECRHSGILTYFRDARRIDDCGHCDICAPDSTRRIQVDRSSFVTRRKSKKGATSLPARSRVVEPDRDFLASAESPLADFSDLPPPKRRATTSDEPLTAEQEALAQRLREWRKRFAAERDQPAFLVFSNRTLHALAQAQPKTADDLLSIYGLGEHRVGDFGAQLLEVMNGSG